MKNTFGNAFAVTVFGESHGAAVGIVLDGLTPGTEINKDKIAQFLSRRRPSLPCDTARREKDEFSILSGEFGGKATGSPLCIVIPNKEAKSEDYSYGKARPSHADYTAFEKYHGFEDYRGGGHFSGRVTAAFAAAGGILIPALEKCGIYIGTHISKCGEFTDRSFDNITDDIFSLSSKSMPVLDDEAGKNMLNHITEVGASGDSAGGITETVIYGIEPGIGEPLFDSVEGKLSQILFSVGGIKGVEFGSGFEGTALKGSEFNDEFCMNNGKIITKTNNNAGINGGITNGMPVLFRCAVKPTPSISKKQCSVDFINKTDIEISVKGRHDPAIIRRICPVIDSVTAIAVCDMLAARYGNDFLTRGIK